jgi:hypothetical protein
LKLHFLAAPALPLVCQPNNVTCLWHNCTFLFCLVYFVNQFNSFLQTTVYSTLWTLSTQSLSNAPRSPAKIQYHHLVILAPRSCLNWPKLFNLQPACNPLLDPKPSISSPIPISEPIVIIIAPAEYLLYTYYTYIKLFSMFIPLYIYQDLF